MKKKIALTALQTTSFNLARLNSSNVQGEIDKLEEQISALKAKVQQKGQEAAQIELMALKNIGAEHGEEIPHNAQFMQDGETMFIAWETASGSKAANNGTSKAAKTTKKKKRGRPRKNAAAK